MDTDNLGVWISSDLLVGKSSRWWGEQFWQQLQSNKLSVWKPFNSFNLFQVSVVAGHSQTMVFFFFSGQLFPMLGCHWIFVAATDCDRSGTSGSFFNALRQPVFQGESAIVRATKETPLTCRIAPAAVFVTTGVCSCLSPAGFSWAQLHILVTGDGVGNIQCSISLVRPRTPTEEASPVVPNLAAVHLLLVTVHRGLNVLSPAACSEGTRKLPLRSEGTKFMSVILVFFGYEACFLSSRCFVDKIAISARILMEPWKSLHNHHLCGHMRVTVSDVRIARWDQGLWVGHNIRDGDFVSHYFMWHWPLCWLHGLSPIGDTKPDFGIFVHMFTVLLALLIVLVVFFGMFCSAIRSFANFLGDFHFLSAKQREDKKDASYSASVRSRGDGYISVAPRENSSCSPNPWSLFPHAGHAHNIHAKIVQIGAWKARRVSRICGECSPACEHDPRAEIPTCAQEFCPRDCNWCVESQNSGVGNILNNVAAKVSKC